MSATEVRNPVAEEMTWWLNRNAHAITSAEDVAIACERIARRHYTDQIDVLIATTAGTWTRLRAQLDEALSLATELANAMQSDARAKSEALAKWAEARDAG